MTNCEKAQSLLGWLFDGELDPAQRDMVAAHVEGCERCANELDALALLDRNSKRLPSFEPPPDLWRRISERLAVGPRPAARTEEQPTRTKAVSRRQFVLMGGGAFAASIGVAVLASLLIGRSRSDTAKEAKSAPRISDSLDPIVVNLSLLGPEDHRLAESQEVCAADGCDVRLGAEGQPVKLVLQDTPVFCCSEECAVWARANPGKALAKGHSLVYRQQPGSGPAKPH
jgi:hypothetical protein